MKNWFKKNNNKIKIVFFFIYRLDTLVQETSFERKWGSPQSIQEAWTQRKQSVNVFPHSSNYKQRVALRRQRGGGRRKTEAAPSGRGASAGRRESLPLLSSEGFTSRMSSAVWNPAATSFTRTAGDSGKLTNSRCILKAQPLRTRWRRARSARSPRGPNPARPAHAAWRHAHGGRGGARAA